MPRVLCSGVFGVWKRQLEEGRCKIRSLVSRTCQGPGSPGVFKGIFLSGSVQVLRARKGAWVSPHLEERAGIESRQKKKVSKMGCWPVCSWCLINSLRRRLHLGRYRCYKLKVLYPGINGTWRVGGADVREASGSVWSG